MILHLGQTLSRWSVLFFFYFYFFNCYLASSRPTLGHYRGGSLTHLMLITCVFTYSARGSPGASWRVGSLNSAERLVGFQPETFRSWSQRLNPLVHSPQSGLVGILNWIFRCCKNISFRYHLKTSPLILSEFKRIN